MEQKKSMKDPLLSVEEGVPVVLIGKVPEAQSTTPSWVVLFLAFGMVVATATCLSPEMAVLLLIVVLLALAPKKKGSTSNKVNQEDDEDTPSRNPSSEEQEGFGGHNKRNDVTAVGSSSGLAADHPRESFSKDTALGPEEVEAMRDNIRLLQSLCFVETVETSAVKTILEQCTDDYQKIQRSLTSNNPSVDLMELLVLNELSLDAIQAGVKVVGREANNNKDEEVPQEEDKASDNKSETYYVTDHSIVDQYSGGSDKGNYTGFISKSTGLPHGQGRMEYQGVDGSPGKWYEGGWDHGCWEGQGRYRNDGGDVYKGELLEDQKHGQGTMRFADGRFFVGEYAKNQMTKGKMTYKDGSTYEGEWENGMRHGRGTCVFTDDAVYEGDFIGGEFHGQGQMTWADGGWYKGEWKNGETEGHGKEILPDGTLRHEGLWNKGKPVRRWR